MQKCFKLLTAGILATNYGVKGMPLTSLAPATTVLSGDIVLQEVAPARITQLAEPTCDHQCAEDRVAAVLDAMVAEVDDLNEECLAAADDRREELLADATQLRKYLASAAEMTANTAIEELDKEHAESPTMPLAVSQEMQADIDREKRAVVERVQKLREETIHKIKVRTFPHLAGTATLAQVAAESGAKPAADPTLRADVQGFVDAFHAAVAAEREAFDLFLKGRPSDLDTALEGAKTTMAGLTSAQGTAFGEAAQEATAQLTRRKGEALDLLDATIEEKLTEADATVVRLERGFAGAFREKLGDVHADLDDPQRDQLVYRALSKKAEFLTAIGDLWNELAGELVAARATLESELDAELAALTDAQTAARNALRAKGAGLGQTLEDQASAARLDLAPLADTGAAWIEAPIVEEEQALTKFLGEFEPFLGPRPDFHVPYKPPIKHLFGEAKAVYREIQNFGDEIADDFIAGQTGQLEADRLGISDGAETATAAILEDMEMTLKHLTDGVVMKLEAGETDLESAVMESEENQTASRGAIEARVAEKKHGIVGRVAVLHRELDAASGFNALEQQALTEMIKALEEEFYGYANSAVLEFHADQAKYKEEWDSRLGSFSSGYEAALAEKLEVLKGSLEGWEAAQTAVVEDASAEFDAKYDEARGRAAAAEDAFKAALQARYDEIDGKIAALHHLHIFKLRTALDEQKAAADAGCAASAAQAREALEQQLALGPGAFARSLEAETRKFTDASTAAEAECKTAVAAQASLLQRVSSELTADFRSHQQEEAAAFSDFIRQTEQKFAKAVKHVKYEAV